MMCGGRYSTTADAAGVPPGELKGCLSRAASLYLLASIIRTQRRTECCLYLRRLKVRQGALATVRIDARSLFSTDGETCRPLLQRGSWRCSPRSG